MKAKSSNSLRGVLVSGGIFRPGVILPVITVLPA